MPATFVTPRSLDLLNALIGPKPHHVMSARNLATRIGVSKTFIAYLLTAERTTCSRDIAARIADTLGVSRRTLWQVAPSTTKQHTIKQKETA